MVKVYYPVNMSCKVADSQVRRYLQKHPEANPSDVAIAIELEPERAIAICKIVRNGRLESL